MRYPDEFLLYETMLAKLGSRTVLIPKPNRLHVTHAPLGFGHDHPINLTLAAWCRGRIRCLPLTGAYGEPGGAADPFFEDMRQEIGLTYVAYHCRSRVLPFEVTFTLSAPWYPGDVMLSTAPFFYLTASVTNTSDRRADGSILVAVENPFACAGEADGPRAESRFYETHDLLGFTFEDTTVQDFREILATSRSGVTYSVQDAEGGLYGHFAEHGSLPDHVNKRPAHCHSSALAWKFALAPGQEARKVFVWASYVPGPALIWEDAAVPFLFTRFFHDAEAVVDYAFRAQQEVEQKIQLLESTVRDSSLSEPLKKLLPFAAQSYIANTWWVEREPPAFTVWEGGRRFHSSLDPAYHAEVFSLLYWPELLRTQLDQWTRFQIGDYLSRDLGVEEKALGPASPADMPVEANADWLLLLHAYWKFTGDDSLIQRHGELIQRLMRFIWLTDHDADGIPDEPAAVVNTFDDGASAVRASAGQTYLGIKCMAATMAARSMALALGNEELGKACSTELARTAATLQSRSFRSDHFVLCLDKQVAERDVHTSLACQGLLYALAAQEEIDFPLDLVAQDIQAHLPQLTRRFGTVHSEADHTLWISTNIFRDLVGLYLGLPLEERAEGYWEFELLRNVFDGGAYTDGYEVGRHRFDRERYPRGAAAFGYFLALPRLTVDRPRGRLSFAPLAPRFRYPLISLADWRHLRIPWISLECQEDEAVFQITEFGRVAAFSDIRGRLRFEREPKAMSVQGEATVEWVGSPQRLESGLWELSLTIRAPAKTIEIPTVVVTFQLGGRTPEEGQ